MRTQASSMVFETKAREVSERWEAELLLAYHAAVVVYLSM